MPEASFLVVPELSVIRTSTVDLWKNGQFGMVSHCTVCGRDGLCSHLWQRPAPAPDIQTYIYRRAGAAFTAQTQVGSVGVRPRYPMPPAHGYVSIFVAV